MRQKYLTETPMLDYQFGSIRKLISQKGWLSLNTVDRIGAAYDFVRNEIRFGYNSHDTLTASQVLADGYGQCNTKGTLLMALLRALGVPCRFHGFTIDKSLQRGVVPELVYPIAPQDIIHSWVEVQFDGSWINLEGFILEDRILASLQDAFPDRSSLCAYGAGTDRLQNPSVQWTGSSTYIQKTGINQDFGVFDSPDEFYAIQRQLTGFRGFVYRLIVRHWMNRRVERIRNGNVPHIPGGNHSLTPTHTPLSIMEIN